MQYANIIAAGSQRRILTGATGAFRLSLDSSGNRVIEVRRIGYLPVTLNLLSWPDTALRIVLADAARTLSTVTVSAERTRALAIHGFYERVQDAERGINHGFFVTPEEIEAHPGRRVTDFLLGQPGVRVTLVSEGPFGRGRKGWQPQGLDGCRIEIYVDGTRFYPLLGDRDLWINDIVQPNQVAGIEVYPRSVTAPPRYQSLNGRCGVMLIWTK